MCLKVYLFEPWNCASRNFLKSHNHALHDIRIFIDTPLNFPARVELLNTFFLLRLTQPTPGIEPGGWIDICDHRMSSVSAKLENKR